MLAHLRFALYKAQALHYSKQGEQPMTDCSVGLSDMMVTGMSLAAAMAVILPPVDMILASLIQCLRKGRKRLLGFPE